MFEFFLKNSVKSAILTNPSGFVSPLNKIQSAPQSHLPSALKFLIVLIFAILFLGTVNANLTDNLVSYYKLDETSGITLVDEKASYDLTLNAGTVNQTGIIDKAVSFTNANSQYARNTSMLSTPAEWTMCGWVYPTGGSQLALAFGSGTASTGITIIKSNGGGTVGSAGTYISTLQSGVAWDSVKTTTNWTDNAWNFVCLTRTGTTYQFYKNGSSITTTGTPTVANNTNFGIGATTTNNPAITGTIDEVGYWSRVLTSNEIEELYNSGFGLTYPFLPDSVNANFDYSITETQVDLNDTSRVDGDAVIDSWEWLIDDVSVSTDQNYSFTGTEATDYNVCLIVEDTTLSLEDSDCQTFQYNNWTPTTTFSSSQVSGTTDQNITLTCTDNNTGCKTINYNINNEGWKIEKNTTNYFDATEIVPGIAYPNFAKRFTFDLSSNPENYFYTVSTDCSGHGTDQTTYVYAIYTYNDDTTTQSDTNQKTGSGFATLNLTLPTNGKSVKTVDYYLSRSSSDSGKSCKNWTLYVYDGSTEPYSFLYSGAGDHNIQYFSTDNSDNNETIKTSTFTTYGLLKLNFFDDTSETSLDEVYIEFNGTPYYSDSNTFIYIDLNGLTSGSKTILLQRTGYQEKSFSLNLNQYSDINYNIGFIESSNISEVNFQVFTETGTLKPNTSFIATDNDNDYLIDIKTTDSQGRVTFYLNNQKSDYNFVSTDLNFGTTTWTINKPKDASTLIDIVGNWKYSITGNSYSSGTNIVNNIQKILLQNTVNPYYIKIQDVNENYAESSFGLKSVTSEKTKTLNPYLYPFGSANLVLIKLLDFSTNQPVSTFNELQLSLYTDSNGLIEIGTYINDSTGTYNIYMDSNTQYKLVVDEQTFILKPTLSIYYLYLTTPSGLEPTNDVNTITNDFVDLNSPTLFLEVRQYFFGCSIEEENCYPSMIFSLIFLVILAVGLSVYLTVGSLEQSILIFVLLAIFTFIGFIPVWLFAISAVIAFMWGVFS